MYFSSTIFMAVSLFHCLCSFFVFSWSFFLFSFIRLSLFFNFFWEQTCGFIDLLSYVGINLPAPQFPLRCSHLGKHAWRIQVRNWLEVGHVCTPGQQWMRGQGRQLCSQLVSRGEGNFCGPCCYGLNICVPLNSCVGT